MEMMEEEEDFLVPQNSFADERELCDSGGTKSRKATQLSLATTTSTASGLREKKYYGSPSQLLQSITHEGTKTSIKSSERSLLSENGSIHSQKLSSKLLYDMEMLRSGHSTINQLKSRLYNRPVDSEVFRTISTSHRNLTGNMVYGNKLMYYPRVLLQNLLHFSQ